ncbi:uncharacterized protein DNG_03587 [Cephalotrichum gorgonifer]|uniref:Uncharacterized protein n=1 Tax=Cephalotrichum gorgonifer TaxID=2041049 RepID=A0AAE8STS4_9PEZI|nr:uncharacterized protein DNG_03587 [Cephalotrichum gorgonifer]
MAWDVREIVPPGPPAELEPEPYTGTRRRFRLVNRPMSVRVSARFFDPVKVEYTRSFDASKTFRPTPEICEALLRRVEHCSEELITRKDASALEPGPDRPPRFEISYQLADAPCSTTEKVITSYQERPSDMDQATEVILAIDRMIGLFFLRHDKDFKWVSGPVKESISGTPRTAKPGGGRPESLACVPRCRFFPSSQSYEFVPGYQLELSFSSTCTTRRPLTISKILRLSSGQCSPLTLPIGEDLLSAATDAINAAVDSRKRSSVGFRWLASTNDTVSINLRIKNNLGPDHKHLTYSLELRESLFSSPNGLDCIMFLDQVYRSLSRVADRVDDAIGNSHELEVKILEVRGAGWEAVEPLSVFLDSTISYSRRTVEAILDRVHTGVASILHGNDNAITLSIYHRGHLVLDKTLVAHKDPAVVKRPPLSVTPKQEGNLVISSLADRIREDIAMICTDTCALDFRGYALPNLGVVRNSHALRAAEPAYVEAPRHDAPQQPVMYNTPPPSRHSNALVEGAAVASGPILNAPSTPQSRAPYRSERNPAEEEDMDLTPPSTPSLVDGDLDTPRDSVLITPPAGIKTGQGMPELSSYGPRIVDDDAGTHDPIVRDFADISHTASDHKGYYSQRMLPISKSDHHFGGPLVPHDTPTPARNIVVVSEDEDEEEKLPDTPSNPRILTKERPEPSSPSKSSRALESGPVSEPTPENWPNISCKPLDLDQGTGTITEPEPEKDESAEPVLEGWLEYRCDPLDPLDQEGDTVTEAIPKDGPTHTVLEGWLEYRCEPLDQESNVPTGEAVIDEPIPTASPILEGWLEYCCEPLEPECTATMAPTTPEEPREVTVCSSVEAIMVEDHSEDSLPNDESNDKSTHDASAPPTPVSLEICDSNVRRASTSEVAYTAPECMGEEVLPRIQLPDAATTTLFDAPEVIGSGVPPALLCEMLPSQESENGVPGASKQDAEEDQFIDVEHGVDNCDEPKSPLVVVEAVIDGPLPLDLNTEENQDTDIERGPDNYDDPESSLVVAGEMIGEPLPLDISTEEGQSPDIERGVDNCDELENPLVVAGDMIDDPLPLNINTEEDQGPDIERGVDNCDEPESPLVVPEAMIDEPLALNLDTEEDRGTIVECSPDICDDLEGPSAKLVEAMTDEPLPLDMNPEEDRGADVERGPDNCDDSESPVVVDVAMIDSLPLDVNAEEDQGADIEHILENCDTPESPLAVIEAVIDEPLPLDIIAEEDQSTGVESALDDCNPESPLAVIETITDVDMNTEDDQGVDVEHTLDNLDNPESPLAVIEAIIDEPSPLDLSTEEDLDTEAERRLNNGGDLGSSSVVPVKAVIDEPLPLDANVEAAVESKDGLDQIAEPEAVLADSGSDTDGSGSALPPSPRGGSLPLDANSEATVETKHDSLQIDALGIISPKSGSDTDSTGLSSPSTPEDEPMPTFFQDTSTAKGKEVALDIELSEPSGPIQEAEDVEVARAIADIIDIGFEKSQDAGQSKDATTETEQRLEAGDEISQLAAGIDAAYEWHTIEELAGNVQTPGAWPGEEGDGDSLELADAIIEIDSAVEKTSRAEDEPLGDVKQLIPGAYEMVGDEISQAVAEIEAAVVKSSATWPREEKSRKDLEPAPKEKDTLELAQAVTEIDTAVERRLIKRGEYAKGRRNYGCNSKALKTVPALEILVPSWPGSSRHLAHSSSRPISPILRPTSNLSAYPALRTNSVPSLFIPRLDTLPREAIPFSGPVHGRKSSVTIAGHVGLRSGQVFPLQDALFGTRSRSGFFGASPVLSCVTAECKSGREVTERGEREEEVTVEGVAESVAEDDAVEDVVEIAKRREDTPPASPKFGYGALPGLLFWAAGVTIASSAFRRA